jgi:hypothetical protein
MSPNTSSVLAGLATVRGWQEDLYGGRRHREPTLVTRDEGVVGRGQAGC